MKTLILFFFILISSFSFGQWAEINNGLYGADVYKMVKYGDYYIIATNTPGGIYKIKNNQDTWVKSNNSLADKRVYSFAVKGNHLFAGTYDDGIYVADGPELNWTKRSAGIDSIIIACIAVNGENIYAGTNNGLYISTNNGFKWSHISSLDRQYVAYIAFDNGRIIVGANNKIYTESGLLISADSGKTWSVKNNGLSNMDAIIKVVIDGLNTYAVSNNGNVYVSGDMGETWMSGGPLPNGLGLIIDIAVINGNVFAATIFHGAVVSFNNCQSWTVISEGLRVNVLNSILADGDTLLAGSSGMGVYKSVDYGLQWSQFGCQGLNEAQVNSVSKAGDKLYSGVKGGLYSSTDNGTNWLPAAIGIDFDDARSVAEYGGDLFLGTNAGLFQSSDNGANWVENLKYNYYYSPFNCLGVNNNKLYAGLGGGQSFMKTSDCGETWEKIGAASPLFNKSVGKLFFAGDYIIVTASDMLEGKNYYSTDDGVNWEEMDIQGTSYAYCFLHFGSQILASGHRGLIKTPFGQMQWEKFITGSKLDSAIIMTLVSTGPNIFAGTGNRGVFISKDSGNTWAETNTGLGSKSIKKLYISLPFVYAITDNARLYRANLSDFGITSVEEHFALDTELKVIAGQSNETIILSFSDAFNSDFHVQIFDYMGRLVECKTENLSENGVNRASISTAGFQQGIYFIRVKTGNRILHGKICISE